METKPAHWRYTDLPRFFTFVSKMYVATGHRFCILMEMLHAASVTVAKGRQSISRGGHCGRLAVSDDIVWNILKP